MVTYEYNIYKSKNVKFINSMLKECCFVWNRALAIQRKYYKIFGKHVSYNRMSGHFTKRYKNVLLHSQTRQEILMRLDSAYSRFFKRLANRHPPIAVKMEAMAAPSATKSTFTKFIHKLNDFPLKNKKGSRYGEPNI